MANKKNSKILIVEDDVYLLNSLRQKLKHEGFTPISAKDGSQGLKIAIKEKPDLILLDIIMPKMDGLEMLQKLRKNPWGQTATVILLSNDDDPNHIKETLKEDAADYLIKSDWSLEDIVAKIKETLGLI